MNAIDYSAPLPFPLPSSLDTYQTRDGRWFEVAFTYSTIEKAIDHKAWLTERGNRGYDVLAEVPEEMEDYTVLYQDEDGCYYAVDPAVAEEVAEEVFAAFKEDYEPDGTWCGPTM